MKYLHSLLCMVFACLFVFTHSQLLAAPKAGVALYNPATKKDISHYDPGMSVKMEIKTPDEQTSFKQAYCPQASDDMIKIAVQLNAYDGNTKVATWRAYVPGQAKESFTTLNVWRDPSNTKMKEWPETTKYREFVFKQLTEPKAYNLEFIAEMHCGNVVPLGTVNLKWDVSGNRFAAWQQALGGYEKAAAAKNFMRDAGQSNSKLEKEMKSLLKDQGFEIRRLVILDKDWHIQRNAKDEITHRTIFAEMAYKEKDGSFRIREVSFKQDYLGNNTWGDTKRFGWGPRNVPTLEKNIP